MKSMLISMLMACSTATALAQDHSRAQSAVDTKLLVENEFVQVVRISIPPHGKRSMHDVSPHIVIWMADAHFVDRYADGTVREEMRKAGSAEWRVGATSRRREYVGQTNGFHCSDREASATRSALS